MGTPRSSRVIHDGPDAEGYDVDDRIDATGVVGHSRR